MNKEYSNSPKNSIELNSNVFLKEEVSEAKSNYWLYISISFLAAIVGLYFFSRVALEESDNQLDNYALIARAVIFVVAKSVLFHYLNKKSKSEIKILFLFAAVTSMSLLGFEIWSITISARDFIEKPVASYQAKNIALKNCDSQIEMLKNKIHGLQEKGFEKVNSRFKHFRESGGDLIAQSSKKESELSNEITRCDSMRIHNTPPRFALWGDAAKLFYSWGMSIIVVLISDLFSAMAGNEKKELKILLRNQRVEFDKPDGTDPDSERPSFDKKKPSSEKLSPVQAPSFATVNAVVTESVTTENQGVNFGKNDHSKSPDIVIQETSETSSMNATESAITSPEGEAFYPMEAGISGDQVSQKKAVKKRFVSGEKWRETPASGEEYQRVVKALMEDGVKCAVNPVKDAARLGHGKAKWCLEMMVERGILIKDGYSYDHAHGKKVRKKRAKKLLQPKFKVV